MLGRKNATFKKVLFSLAEVDKASRMSLETSKKLSMLQPEVAQDNCDAALVALSGPAVYNKGVLVQSTGNENTRG